MGSEKLDVPREVASMHKKVVKLGETVEAKLEQLKGLLHELQANCPHTLVAEAGWVGSTIFSEAKTPVRVCEICGLQEEGWRFYYLTTDRPRRVGSREELWTIRGRLLRGTRVGIDEDDKPPLKAAG